MRAIFLLLIVALLTGCSSSPTREYPADQLEDMQPDHRVEIVWSRSAGSGIGAVGDALEPAVHGGEVVVVGHRGRLSGFDLETGRPLWRSELEVQASAGPTVTDELIVIGTRDGRIIALDRESREMLWERNVTSEVLAAPAVDGDTVAVMSNDGRVFAMRAESGARRWLYDRTMPPLTLRGTSAPLLTSGRVYAGLPNGRVVALDRNDGSLVWEARAGVARGASDIERMRDIVGNLLLQQGVLFAVAYQGEAVALDPASGSTGWSRELSSNAGLTSDRERVYVTETSGRIWALDRGSGAAIWRQDETEGLRATAPVLHDGRVVFGDDRGALTWLDARDGEIVVRRTLRARDDSISRPPREIDGDLLVQSDRGRLYRVRLVRRD